MIAYTTHVNTLPLIKWLLISRWLSSDDIDVQ